MSSKLWLSISLYFCDGISESEVTCQVKPEDPKIVLLDVDSDVVSLKWDTCNVDAGETLVSVFFSRLEIGSVSPEQIAARSANAGFTMKDPFKDFKKYRALLDQELRIYDVQRNEKYVYTLTMNYDNSAGVPKSTIFQVTVVVKGKKRIFFGLILFFSRPYLHGKPRLTTAIASVNFSGIRDSVRLRTYDHHVWQ